MNFELLLGGVGFLFAGFLIYRYLLKDQKPSSAATDWEGMTRPNYIGLWGSVILCLIVGIGLMFESCNF